MWIKIFSHADLLHGLGMKQKIFGRKQGLEEAVPIATSRSPKERFPNLREEGENI